MMARPVVQLAITFCAIAWIIGPVHSQGTFNIRIAPGTGDGRTYGRLEISKSGTVWGTVCDTNFDDKEALVICKELGFRWGRAYSNSSFGAGTGQIFLDSVNCAGTESKFSLCTNGGWGTHSCNHKREAGVHCYTSTVYVPASRDGVYGPVMVWRENKWMPVCDPGWNQTQATVVCKQLNFTHGYSFCCSKFQPLWQSATSYSRAITNVICQNSSVKLEDCSSVFTNGCGYRQQASVVCVNQTDKTKDFAVRLTQNGKPNNVSGRLEVRYKGKWGCVCAKNASDEIASVACQEMGYPGGWLLGPRSSSDHRMIWMRNIFCNGTEKSVKNCRFNGWGESGNCDHSDEVHVLCYKNSYTDVECLTTKTGTEYSGRQSKTASGYTCQRWDQHYPHSHGFTDSIHFPENNMADAVNYCRNPDNWHDGPWCYTTNPSKRWDICNIPMCKSEECRYTIKGEHYDGTLSKTKEGYTCQRWDSQTPHSHGMANSTMFPEGNATAAKNYCRNPDVDGGGPWCYTTNPSVRFAYCDVPYCAFHADCKRTPLGREYMGQLSHTTQGFACINWSDGPTQDGNSSVADYKFPERSRAAAKNYCRNPTNKRVGPWCYVKHNGKLYFDRCDVKECNKLGIRLMGGPINSHGGRVEVLYDGKWGTICDKDWDNKEADVVCRQLGYATGMANRTTYMDKAKGPVWLNGMNCTGNESMILKCGSSSHWNITDSVCLSHSRDAGVLCSIQVKLLYGYQRTDVAFGMVTIYNKTLWWKVCGDSWTQAASTVACRQLGYSYGKRVCCDSVGRSYLRTLEYYPNCTGKEKSLHECKFVRHTCQNQIVNYAAVMCSKTPFKPLEVHLGGYQSKYGNITGNVIAASGGATGYICKDHWGDMDARVACRQLGLKDGKALQYRKDARVNVIASNFSCTGNEKHISECKYSNQTNCESTISYKYSRQAGVICYNKTGIKFKIVGKTPGQGRIEVEYDGVVGSVCDALWSRYDSRVFCKMMGYADGDPVLRSYYGRGTGPIYLTGFSCTGVETSLLHCINFGWRRTYSSCIGHTRDAGVRCYHNVRLYYSSTGNTSTPATLGLVGVQSAVRGWGRVCSKGFDDTEALVVCRELQYTQGRYLGPGIFYGTALRARISNVDCRGSEDSIVTCRNTTSIPRSCAGNYSDYATVLCYTANKGPNFKLSPNKPTAGIDYYQEMYFEDYGLKTRVCTDSWTDSTAHVTCRQLGYKGGYAVFGTSYNRVPALRSVFNCTNTSTSIEGCRTDYRSSKVCKDASGLSSVLCYNKAPGVQFRVAGGPTRTKGRAEIGYEGKWGTICTSAMGRYPMSSMLTRLAKVHCRSLGYRDGLVSASRVTPTANSTAFYLNVRRCSGNEPSLLQCQTYGWMGMNSSCLHGKDLVVSCISSVRIGRSNSESYGPLYVLRPGFRLSYGLVCDKGFTDREAAVACRTLGYTTGKAICCSAFGSNSGLMIAKDVQCPYDATSISQCKNTTIGSMWSCPTRHYVSVACFDQMPPSTLTISVANHTSPIPNTISGPVSVKYLGITGYICPTKSWTDSVARVICKMQGYGGGQVYRHIPRPSGPTWIGNVSCSGNERTLYNCQYNPAHLFGGADCGSPYPTYQSKVLSVGGVLCWRSGVSPPKYEIVNGTKYSGQVSINFNGVRGSICDRGFFNDEASAVCRDIGYIGGSPSKVYRTISFSHFIRELNCKTNASSLRECPHRAWGYQYNSYCQAASVTCYGRARIVGGPRPYFGRIELMVNGKYLQICDEGFDDRAARVACRQLGYIDGKKVCCSTLRGAPVTGQVVKELRCTRSITKLESCPNTIGFCNSRKYASVYCVNETIVPDYPMKYKLSQDDGLSYSGTVKVLYKGTWGRVCSKGWTDNAANVFCKQLGKLGGVAFTPNLITPQPVMIKNVKCSPGTTRLEDCSYDDVINSGGGCDRYSASAGVLCFNREVGIQYRLASGGYTYGRAEVRYDGRWGTICHDSWSDNDAKVFCKALGRGFVAGTGVRRSAYSGATGSPVWFSDTFCNGNETSILQCPSSGWLNPSSSFCKTHWKDAKVRCYGKVRVSPDRTGVVQVYTAGNWRTICNTGWGKEEADVVCRSYGYGGGYPICCGAFGYNYLQASMTDFRCNGKEKNLLDCPYRNATVGQLASCRRRDYAAVSCYNETITEYSDIRLSGVSNTGTVQILVNGAWGRICLDGWTNMDARVVCRELGFKDGTPYTHYELYYAYGGAKPYWTSNVQCTGMENSLRKCRKTPYGTVASCKSAHSAGVLCFKNSGVTFRMTGSKLVMTGTAEVMVDGVWGTICSSHWDDNDAGVFCRSQNFADGTSIRRSPYGHSASTIWYNPLRCFGNESNLDECPHGSWKKSYIYQCRNHKSDAAVFCFGHVRITNKTTAMNVSTGAVQVYAPSLKSSRVWYPICDEKFTDQTARLVCRDLGFIDGRAICCSAFGHRFGTLTNNTLSLQNCLNSPQPIQDCAVRIPLCKNGTYASVMCLTEKTIGMVDYEFKLEDSKSFKGIVLVSVHGTTGRVCTAGWDNLDATVFCKSRGFNQGVAYSHSNVGSNMGLSGSHTYPYLVSDVACTGSEKSLSQCKFNNASSLNRNCTDGHDAAVLCFASGGIEYRRVAPADDTPKYAGRVEIKVGEDWGTVCDRRWGTADSKVFCRSKGFNDGDPMFGAAFGQGKGPIWLSHLQCTGNEKALHLCPHRGFNTSFDEDPKFWDLCKTHSTDAGVVCYKNVRLNQKYQRYRHHQTYGTLEAYNPTQKKWGAVCTDGFNDVAAKVACVELGYADGRAVPRTSFGNVSGDFYVKKTSCNDGNEVSVVDCKKSSSSCNGGQYAGVYCSNETIVDRGFKIKMAGDKFGGRNHGALEVIIKGVEGKVCGYNWNRPESEVACKQMGYAGGVPLTHIALNMKPIVMSNVSCTSDKRSIYDCDHQMWADNYACSFKSYEAGVICYRKSYKMKLSGGTSPSNGRVDIEFDGVMGTVCDNGWTNANARVVCRELGFADGIAKLKSFYGRGTGQIWFQRFLCHGTEKTLMQCLNTGFNITVHYSSCFMHQNDASVKCFNKEIVLKKVRLVDGNATAGRLEVYASGVDAWGTVCRDLFNVNAARVVCRMLGLSGGKPTRAYPPGVGEILLDNVRCKGDEKHIKDCRTNDIGTHNCQHVEDIGVICEGPTTTTTTTTTKRTTTTTTRFTTTTTTKPSVVTPEKRGGVKPGILAAIIVPIILLVAIVAAVALVVYLKMRRVKELPAEPARECPMQISNALYDLAMEERPPAQDLPSNFENPMYDNANMNKFDTLDGDNASGVYASLDTPKMSPKPGDGAMNGDPSHTTSDKAGLVDNIVVGGQTPGSQTGSKA